MRVTSKGQVTIPKTVRDRLGIKPGSDVEFVEGKDGIKLVSTKKKTFDAEAFKRTLDRLEGSLDPGGMSTDEYMLWLRGPRDDLNPR